MPATSPPPEPAPIRVLVLHSRVAPVGLLVDHLTDVRTWAGRALGDLMRDDEATVRLRETVQVFLDARGSSTDAAARLHVHKNTVHYRVRKAEELLGHPLTENCLTSRWPCRPAPCSDSDTRRTRSRAAPEVRLTQESLSPTPATEQPQPLTPCASAPS